MINCIELREQTEELLRTIFDNDERFINEFLPHFDICSFNITNVYIDSNYVKVSVMDNNLIEETLVHDINDVVIWANIINRSTKVSL